MEASGDIAPWPPGSAEGEAALWRAFRGAGSDAARNRLFDLHLAFARQIATRHFLDRRSGDLELADLCQLACAGLLEAIDRFDPARGAPFRAYARRRISGSILDGLTHLSERREQLSFRQRARRDRLRSLSVADAEKLGAADAMLALIEMATGLAIGFMIEGNGLYAVENQADGAPSPYDSLAWKEAVRAVMAEVSNLSGQACKVIRYHYLDGLAFDQIGEILGVSKGRVSQIHRAALKSLRDRLSPGVGFRLET